jgi:hypothetical protein
MFERGIRSEGFGARKWVGTGSSQRVYQQHRIHRLHRKCDTLFVLYKERVILAAFITPPDSKFTLRCLLPGVPVASIHVIRATEQASSHFDIQCQ